MKIVLDASAALAAALQHSSAESILRALEQATVVIAPDLCAAELAHSLRRYAAARQMEPHAAARLLEHAIGLIDRFIPTAVLAQEVLHEAVSLDASIGDLCYAILARREAAPVLTIDRKLERLLVEMRVASVLKRPTRRS